MANHMFSLTSPPKVARRLFFLLRILLLSLIPVLVWGSCVSLTVQEDLKVIITSDLHFTVSENISNLIVPGMAYANALTDALVEAVIDSHPDLFVMTGDNTNDGDMESATALVKKLERIKEAGIPLLITTGNHDYYKGTMEDFKQYYFPLLEYTDLCSDSLSYTLLLKGVLWIAMDDNALGRDGNGRFSEKTLAWLEEMLEKYKDYPKIFLTHHSLLLGKARKTDSPFYGQNARVLSLLKKAGVRLILAGHLHSQSLSRSDNLYELITSMPLGPNHYLGFLTLSGNTATYQARPLLLSRYGEEGLEMKVKKAEREVARMQKRSYFKAIAKSHYTRWEKKEILKHFLKFFKYYGAGTLERHIEEFTGSPLTPMMIHALWRYNYGPWIAGILAEEPLDATFFRIQYAP